jgi:hypothetical protein
VLLPPVEAEVGGDVIDDAVGATEAGRNVLGDAVEAEEETPDGSAAGCPPEVDAALG